MTVLANSRYLGDAQILATASDGERRMTIYPDPYVATMTRYSWYRVVEGESFESIANLIYGDPTQWWRVANLNPHIFYPGEIPAASYIRKPLP